MFLLKHLTLKLAVLPSVSPSSNNPANSLIVKLVDAGLGILALIMVFGIYWGASRAALAVAGKREGGAGSGVVGAAACLVVLAFIYAGTSYLNKWNTFLGL